jgi:hypothetical protein
MVEAGSFVVAKPTTLSIPHLVLHLSDTFHIESTLATNTLEVYVKKSFTCGKSLIVNGDLTVQAPSLPTQHADIHASGNATLQATVSSIVVGDKQLEATESRYAAFDWKSQNVSEYSERAPSPLPSVNGTIKYVSGHTYSMVIPVTITEKIKADLNTAFYQKTISNGISVSAGLMLTLQSPQHITVKGNIYSAGGFTLKANSQTGVITCEVGQIESLQDTHLYGHHYLNKRTVMIPLANNYTTTGKRWVSYGSEEEGTYGGSYERYFRNFATLTHHLYTDTPALLQTGGDLYFHLSKVENLGSTIAAAGSIYHDGKLIAGFKTPFKSLLKSRLPP